MSWLHRLVNTFRPAPLERDIDRELSFHISERIDQLLADGCTRKEATRRARLQFGNPIVQRQRIRDVNVAAWIDATVRNVRYAIRALSHTPGFTLTVVLTLALGIGANTAVFSAIDAVLLRPLPFPDSDRLVRVLQKNSRTTETPAAPVRIEDWNQLNSTFEGITGFYTEDVSETSADLPEQLRRAYVAPRFVEVWGMVPALGRGFTEAEHQAGGPPAVVISDRYWRRRFAGDPNVLGELVRVAGTTAPIVGVMRPSFRFPDPDVDAWFPRVNDQITTRHRPAVPRARPPRCCDRVREWPGPLRHIGAGILGNALWVTPLDPATLSSVAGIVLGVTTLAALIPAVRAAFTQPMHALREE